MSLSERLDANRHRRAGTPAYVPEVEFAESLDKAAMAARESAALTPVSPLNAPSSFELAPGNGTPVPAKAAR